MRVHSPALILVALATNIACGGTRVGVDDGATQGLDDTHGLGTMESEGGASEGERLDLGPGHRLDVAGDGTGDAACMLADPDGLDGHGQCEQRAPAGSFNPALQWQFDLEAGQLTSWSTPLVGNLTDDNGDGRVDLCDSPDVVISARYHPPEGRPPNVNSVAAGLYVLDGETGTLHWSTERVLQMGTPAIADVDGDGEPEIITRTCEGLSTPYCPGHMIAYRGDGTVLWQGDEVQPAAYGCAVAVADADNDGDPEILCDAWLYDHEGKLLHQFEHDLFRGLETATVFADLDGDGDQEISVGGRAYHHDGTVYFDARIDARNQAFTQIADLDGDGAPEVLVTSSEGITLLEHDGRVKYRKRTPTGVAATGLNWLRPAVIHDFDGDGEAEFAMSSAEQFTTYEGDASIHWTANVVDESGAATATAFDFLGDGTAEAIYSDEGSMRIYDNEGEVLLEVPRTSGTIIEYPVVADLDNDGSAEIAVTSELPGRGFPELGPEDRSPVLQVIRDAEDRWVPARRIWNQHTYHVTNVREDGTIPQFEAPHWEHLNTFRTQAQISNEGVCRPKPQG